MLVYAVALPAAPTITFQASTSSPTPIGFRKRSSRANLVGIMDSDFRLVFLHGFILCKYDCTSGDLFVQICASVCVCLMLCVSVCYALFIGGGGVFSCCVVFVCIFSERSERK